jgi:predicted phosphohydrolase
MKFQYCSDLHLEFPENKKFLKLNPIVAGGDILLLAGDVVPFALLEKHNDFFDFVADNFETTYWIPGNHEYYYADASKRSGTINERIRSNVFLINNEVVKLPDVRLTFTTMWSHISPVNHWEAQQNISDFEVIKFQNKKFNPGHFNQLHQDCLQFLQTAFNEKDVCKTVVVSHHVPTLMNYPEKYRHSNLTEVFAVEMYDLIEKTRPDFWIYGHHHENIEDFKIGPTQLITNQLGYVKQKEHLRFSPSSVITL